MQIIVFGGAGDMGSRAVEDLAHTAGVDRVTIADRDADGAHALAGSLRRAVAEVDVVVVDASAHDALVAAMSGYDVAASALGPFYRFEKRLVRAAIEAGVDYASICDDWTAAEEVFEELDGPARDAGRVIVTGIGASPGLTNVAVRHLSRDMDSVDRVDVYVYQPLDAGGGPAVLEHMLYIMSGKPTAYRDGAWVDRKACVEQRMVDFPKFGKLRVWNMGHAEPITIPRFFPEVREVGFYMGYGRGARALVKPSQWGLFDSERRRRLWLRGLVALEDLTRPEQPGEGALRIDVFGTRDGVRVHEMACGTGTMRDATALPLAAGALAIGRGDLLCEGGGVFAPEAALDPVPFMRQLEPKGIGSFADVAMTKPLMPEEG